MKRVLLFMLVVLTLTFTASGTVLGAPPAAGGGPFFVFGEYAPVVFINNVNEFMVGAGYSLGPAALGFEAQLLGSGWPDEVLYGGFATLDAAPFVLSGETLYSQADNSFFSKLTGLYAFNLGRSGMTLGGGIVFGEGISSFFLESGLNMKLSNDLSLYGDVDYFTGQQVMTYKAGLSYGL